MSLITYKLIKIWLFSLKTIFSEAFPLPERGVSFFFWPPEFFRLNFTILYCICYS